MYADAQACHKKEIITYWFNNWHRLMRSCVPVVLVRANQQMFHGLNSSAEAGTVFCVSPSEKVVFVSSHLSF